MIYRDHHENLRERDELIRLCRKAAQGPWKAVNFQVVPARDFRSKVVPTKVIANCSSYADAAYVAAAHPTMVMSLLGENRQMRERFRAIATNEDMGADELRRRMLEELRNVMEDLPSLDEDEP